MKLEIQTNKMPEAISVMREVALWGRRKGYRVWPEEWLTPEELLTEDVLPSAVEGFGILAGCAGIRSSLSAQAVRTPRFRRHGYDQACGGCRQSEMPGAGNSLHSSGYCIG